jgi:hypothetical protein
MNDRFRPGSGHRWIPFARRTLGMIKDIIMRDGGRLRTTFLSLSAAQAKEGQTVSIKQEF